MRLRTSNTFHLNIFRTWTSENLRSSLLFSVLLVRNTFHLNIFRAWTSENLKSSLLLSVWLLLRSSILLTNQLHLLKRKYTKSPLEKDYIKQVLWKRLRCLWPYYTYNLPISVIIKTPIASKFIRFTVSFTPIIHISRISYDRIKVGNCILRVYRCLKIVGVIRTIFSLLSLAPVPCNRDYRQDDDDDNGI